MFKSPLLKKEEPPLYTKDHDTTDSDVEAVKLLFDAAQKHRAASMAHRASIKVNHLVPKE